MIIKGQLIELAALAFALGCGCSSASNDGGSAAGSGGIGPTQTATGGAVAPPHASSGGSSAPVTGTGSGGSAVIPPGSGGAPAQMPIVDAGTGHAGAPAKAPDAGADASASTDGGAATGTLPPVTSVDMDGPFAVTIDMNAGANSWVFRPMELGKGGVKHPIFVWGTGATSVPMQYTDHFTRVASHGFVVISPNNPMVDAAAMKAALDWILAENDKQDSMYYQKLNTAKVAMGGHSLGSLATFDEEAMETRLTTTIHIAGGSFDGMGSSKVKTPTAYMCGQMDLDIASPQCAVDYQNATQPTYFVQLSGVDHISAARSALPGIVAWLRWWLAGETERKSMFIGPNCDFCKDIWANAMSKNW
jgi:hypothetical protein